MMTRHPLLALLLALFTLATSAIPVGAWDPWGDLTHPDRILRNTEREVRRGARAIDRGRLELQAQAGAPALMNWIIASRDDAIRAGVQPIPGEMRNLLSRHFSERLLRRVRFRAGEGHFLSLQKSAFHLGDQGAITLDYVIVFRHSGDAYGNDELWAHELGHVLQYESWGIRDFAIKYLRSWNSVESGADDEKNRYLQTQPRIAAGAAAPPMLPPRPAFPGAPVGRGCRTAYGVCPIPPLPSGAPCTCTTPWGRIDPGRAM
jgi:hypothetical protein